MSGLAKLDREEKAADDLWKAIYQPETEVEEPGDEIKDKSETASGETREDETASVEEEQTEVAETVTETKEEVKEEKIEPDKSETVEYWKGRFQTVEGKYKAEVPRLSAEIAQWRDHALGLSKKISDLEETVKNLSKIPDAKPEKDQDLEALAEREPDFAKVIQKLKDDHAREMAELRKELETGISADLKTVKEDMNLSKQERFDLAMRNYGVPDWREIDHDPAFKEWLNASVPYTNATKLDLLVAAARNLDAATTSQFFLDFKASQKTPEETATVEVVDDKLNKHIAPPRAGGATIPKKSGPVGLTKAQYEKFMNPNYTFNPSDWGGRTEGQMDALFHDAILRGTLV